jgi:cell division septation protein DedD
MITIRPSTDMNYPAVPPEAAAEEHKKRIPLVWIPATLSVGLLIAAIYLGGRIVTAHSHKQAAANTSNGAHQPARVQPRLAQPRVVVEAPIIAPSLGVPSSGAQSQGAQSPGPQSQAPQPQAPQPQAMLTAHAEMQAEARAPKPAPTFVGPQLSFVGPQASIIVPHASFIGPQLTAAATMPAETFPMINPRTGERYIQVGALNLEATRRFVQHLRSQNLQPHVAPGPTPEVLRVLIGPFDNTDALTEQKTRLQTQGIDTFVRKY